MKRTSPSRRRSVVERRPAGGVLGWICLVRLGPMLTRLAVACALLLVAARAEAMGTLTLHNPAPEEVDGRWKLKFTVNYGKVPHMAHIPMVFSFQHVTKYEWAYTEQSPEKAVFSQRPLSNQPEINIPIDVGFADASGKLFKITKMDVPIRRDPDMGFEAGEYTLTVREGGRTFGRPMRVTLRGENKPIDRRPITFQEKPVESKRPKATSPESQSGDPDGDPLKARDQGDVMVDESGMEGVEAADADGPPAEKPKQGGCGCRLGGPADPPGPRLGVFGLGVGLALARRRRGRR